MLKKVGLTVVTFLSMSAVAMAQEATSAVANTMGGHNQFTAHAALALAVGFGFASAVIGGAISQSRAATAALEGIARNPGASNKVQTPMIIGMALIESLILFAFAMSFLLLGKY